jgi:cytochrome b561
MMEERRGVVEHSAGERYGGPAIALHWLTALLIVGSFTVGLSMVRMPLGRQKLQWFGWHKSIGITIFLLTCLRLAWRATRRAPPPLSTMPQWQRQASLAVHCALYLLLVMIPLSGWVYSSSTGIQVVYLGVFPLPDLVPKDRILARALLTLHLTLNFTLFSLVCVHTAAALKHHFVDRDNVLTRMLPWRRSAVQGKGPR